MRERALLAQALIDRLRSLGVLQPLRIPRLLLSRGDLAGELGFMDSRPHYAALRALGPTRVLCLARQKLESLLEREPVIVYRVMRAIFRVVHVVVNRMAMQTSELTNYIYKVHGKY